MTYDTLAERYLDKVFPQSRREVTPGDLKRLGVPAPLYDETVALIDEYVARNGVRPSVDEVVRMARSKRAAQHRRGI
jgi:hypothetical protein